MQSKWLEDFLLLAQERSFTRAAELRHVTHPAFGRRIRALEAWAGTPLIEAGGGPVRLTPAGEAFATPPSRWCAPWPSRMTSCRPWPVGRPM
jgi:DNA-binding transcriptional LysR family regulator